MYTQKVVYVPSPAAIEILLRELGRETVEDYSKDDPTEDGFPEDVAATGVAPLLDVDLIFGVAQAAPCDDPYYEECLEVKCGTADEVRAYRALLKARL